MILDCTSCKDVKELHKFFDDNIHFNDVKPSSLLVNKKVWGEIEKLTEERYPAGGFNKISFRTIPVIAQ
jgi:hypothetical protein